MREIHVPESAHFPVSGQQFAQHFFRQPTCPIPIVFAVASAKMGESNAGPAVQNRFAYCGDRSGIMNIRPKIAAVIDTGENPIRLRHQTIQANTHAIRRRAVNCESPRTSGINAHRAMRGYLMTTTRLRTRRSNQADFTQFAAASNNAFKPGESIPSSLVSRNCILLVYGPQTGNAAHGAAFIHSNRNGFA